MIRGKSKDGRPRAIGVDAQDGKVLVTHYLSGIGEDRPYGNITLDLFEAKVLAAELKAAMKTVTALPRSGG